MTKQKVEKQYCSKCNRCLTDENGGTIMGIQVSLEGLDKSVQLREQLGKYMPNEGSSVVFKLCWECYLDSIFNDSPYWDGWAK